MNNNEVINVTSHIGNVPVFKSPTDLSITTLDTNYIDNISSTHLGGQGILTYENASHIFDTRRKGNDKKPLCNETYLHYDKFTDRYLVYYEGYKLIEIARHGWYLQPPSSTSILYPGYTSRVLAFLGVHVYKDTRTDSIYMGSVKKCLKADCNTWKSSKRKAVQGRALLKPCSDGSYFIDYSYPLKYNHPQQGLPRKVRNTAVTGRGETDAGWWCTKDYSGRKLAIIGNPARRNQYLNSVVKGYVTNYLTNHGFGSTHNTPTFSAFCDEDNYRYGKGYNKGFVDKLPNFVGENAHEERQYKFLDSKLLYSIDFLSAFRRLTIDNDSDSFNSDTSLTSNTKAITDYGTLLQAMFALRGFKFMSGDTDLAYTNYMNLAGDCRTDTKFIRKILGLNLSPDYSLPPTFNKFEATSIESRAPKHNEHLHAQHAGMSRELASAYTMRRGFIGRFLYYMMSHSGGHESVRDITREQLESFLSSGDQSGSRHNRAESHITGLDGLASLGYISSTFITDNNSGCNGSYWAHPLIPDYFRAKERALISDADGNLSNIGCSKYTLFSEMENPFPRMFFFLMFDEYCSQSLHNKQTLIKLLESEWGAANPRTRGAKSLSGNLSQDLPLSWEIMHTFLHKRIAGLFLPMAGQFDNYNLPNEDSFGNAFGHIHGFETCPNANRYYYRSTTRKETPVPPTYFSNDWSSLHNDSFSPNPNNS